MAQFLDVILYSREQLLKEYEALPYKDGAQDQARPCLAGPALAWLAGCLPACPGLPACLEAARFQHCRRPSGSVAAGRPLLRCAPPSLAGSCPTCRGA